jgi:hypothetical protein
MDDDDEQEQYGLRVAGFDLVGVSFRVEHVRVKDADLSTSLSLIDSQYQLLPFFRI